MTPMSGCYPASSSCDIEPYQDAFPCLPAGISASWHGVLTARCPPLAIHVEVGGRRSRSRLLQGDGVRTEDLTSVWSWRRPTGGASGPSGCFNLKYKVVKD
jgi:hypothetical protein